MTNEIEVIKPIFKVMSININCLPDGRVDVLLHLKKSEMNGRVKNESVVSDRKEFMDLGAAFDFLKKSIRREEQKDGHLPVRY